MNQSTNPYVMLHDEKRCIGCQACTVACKVLNDVPEGFSRLQVQIRSPEHEPRCYPTSSLFAFPVSIVKMRRVSAFVRPVRHFATKMALCKWISLAVLAVTIALPLVRSTSVISIRKRELPTNVTSVQIPDWRLDNRPPAFPFARRMR